MCIIKLKYKSRKINKMFLSRIYHKNIKQISEKYTFFTDKVYILPILEQSGKFYSIEIITDKAADIKRFSFYTNICTIKSLSKWRVKS